MKPYRRIKGLNRAKRIMWRFRLYPLSRFFWGDEIVDAIEMRTFQNLIHTRTACSGPCCGNPRRWFGKRTRQEIFAEVGMREQLLESFND